MKKSSVCLLIVLAWATQAFAAGVLDGKTFTGKIGDANKPPSQAQVDDFMFSEGRFKSTLCSTFGYGSGAYTVTEEKGVVKFEAETASDSGGKMTWSGTVTGDRVQGTAKTVENGQTSESRFTGMLKTETQ